VRGSSKSEDSSLRRVHEGIISSALLVNARGLYRLATAVSWLKLRTIETGP
jgi:hypothetical protein